MMVVWIETMASLIKVCILIILPRFTPLFGVDGLMIASLTILGHTKMLHSHPHKTDNCFEEKHKTVILIENLNYMN